MGKILVGGRMVERSTVLDEWLSVSFRYSFLDVLIARISLD